MAKILSAARALLILEERGASDDDVEEEVSEYEDHIFENSESDSDFEEEDEIEHHLVTKQRWVPHQQPAPGPEQAHQTASEEIWM